MYVVICASLFGGVVLMALSRKCREDPIWVLHFRNSGSGTLSGRSLRGRQRKTRGQVCFRPEEWFVNLLLPYDSVAKCCADEKGDRLGPAVQTLARASNN